MLLKGVLIVENESDRAMVGRIKGLGLNLVTLPRDTLYRIQYGITVELGTREGQAI